MAAFDLFCLFICLFASGVFSCLPMSLLILRILWENIFFIALWICFLFLFYLLLLFFRFFSSISYIICVFRLFPFSYILFAVIDFSSAFELLAIIVIMILKRKFILEKKVKDNIHDSKIC